MKNKKSAYNTMGFCAFCVEPFGKGDMFFGGLLKKGARFFGARFFVEPFGKGSTPPKLSRHGFLLPSAGK
jgi:hypothetical protein